MSDKEKVLILMLFQIYNANRLRVSTLPHVRLSLRGALKYANYHQNKETYFPH